jgi:ferrous-iron efflux pump FieF
MKNNAAISQKLIKMVTLCSLMVAITIISVKIIAWNMTDSLSLLASLVDSALDVGASFISFFAVRYSLAPPDDDHRFGHGKAEDISAFLQSIFIAVSGLYILTEAFNRFLNPSTITNEMIGIVTMVISLILTMGLLLFQKYVILITNSSAIKADSLHYQGDLLVNIVVIGSFLSSMYFNFPLLDTILALFIALYVLFSAIKIGKEAFDKLMDKEFSQKNRDKIINAVLSNKNAKAVHDLRTRRSGLMPFIQFHLELDGEIKLREAHIISDEIEEEILKIFPHAEILIHYDVAGEAVNLNKVISNTLWRYTKTDK